MSTAASNMTLKGNVKLIVVYLVNEIKAKFFVQLFKGKY
jgi:hypothetical protein